MTCMHVNRKGRKSSPLLECFVEHSDAQICPSILKFPARTISSERRRMLRSAWLYADWLLCEKIWGGNQDGFIEVVCGCFDSCGKSIGAGVAAWSVMQSVLEIVESGRSPDKAKLSFGRRQVLSLLHHACMHVLCEPNILQHQSLQDA